MQHLSMVTDNYIPIEQAAEKIFKSSTRFVYKQIEARKLNLYKVGGKSYVKESEANELFRPVAKHNPENNG